MQHKIHYIASPKGLPFLAFMPFARVSGMPRLKGGLVGPLVRAGGVLPPI